MMYSRPHKYLTDQKILHPQELRFRKGRYTEHAIAQLVDQIYESFKKETTPFAFLSTCQRRLIQPIIQYFRKSLRSMELQV